MLSANIPRVYGPDMQLLALLDKAINIGYKQVFNDLWTAQFTLPADDPKNKYCTLFNYVEIYDENRRIELFRIIQTPLERNERGFITYQLEHVITTLIDNILFKFHQIGGTGVFTRQVLEYVLGFQTTQNWVLGKCDFDHQFAYKWESVNLLAALFSIPRPFAEKWHITYNTKTHPWTINLLKAEAEIDCEIRRGKNMQGIHKQVDATNLITRIYPLGYGEGDNQLTIASVNDGVPYIDADTIPIYGLKETIWTDRRFEDAQSLKATATQILDETKTPHISYTVSSIDLFKRTKDNFDEFKEGKMVRVIDRLDNIDIDTRIVEVSKSDVSSADINITLANKDQNIASSIAALQERARINETYAQGSETLIPMTFIDNADENFPAVFEFFIPASMVNINEARLRVQLLPFRAYSRAIQGGGGIATSTSDGGATTQTTTSGGGSWGSTENGGDNFPTTTSEPQQVYSTEAGGATTSGASSANTTATQPAVIGRWNITNAPVLFGEAMGWAGNPPHSHTFHASPVMPEHDHNMQHNHTIQAHHHNVIIPAHHHIVNIQPHSHLINIPEHAHIVSIPPHSHNITLPNHTHEIEFGIFTGTIADSLSIRVDDNTVPITGGLDNINIIPFLRRDGEGRIARNTWHRLELVPNRLTRISASIFLNIFTNSRAGENL